MTAGGWISPLPLRLVPTAASESFRGMAEGCTGLPLPPHPGSFGFVRAHHTHEGVDLYCAPGTPVSAVEPGVVVAVLPFTGAHCTPPSPWWHDTWAVMAEGSSGVVLYGEIVPEPGLGVGALLEAGAAVGRVTPVLRKDKGRPGCMLHLELYAPGARDCVEWPPGAPRPDGLRDPTPLLMSAAGRTP